MKKVSKKVTTKRSAPAPTAPAPTAPTMAKKAAKKMSGKKTAKKVSAKKSTPAPAGAVSTPTAAPAAAAAPSVKAGDTQLKELQKRFLEHKELIDSLQDTSNKLVSELKVLQQRVSTLGALNTAVAAAAADGDIDVDPFSNVTPAAIGKWSEKECKAYLEYLGYDLPDLKGVAAWRSCAAACHAESSGAADGGDSAPLTEEVSGPNGEQAIPVENPFDEETGIKDGEFVYLTQGEDGEEWYLARCDGMYEDDEVSGLFYLYFTIVDEEGNDILDPTGEVCTAAMYDPSQTAVDPAAPVCRGRVPTDQ